MRYVLATLSHGDPRSQWQEDTIKSFVEHVIPTPVGVTQLHDGPGGIYVPDYGDEVGQYETEQGGEPRGFCRATRALWRSAIEMSDDVDADYVFWLEHDFVFERKVDLTVLATLLEDNGIAQVQLMRNAVNDAERRAGGLYESRRGDYVQRMLREGASYHGGVWLEHSAYFTTNPSLMRTSFMAAERFGDEPIENRRCEGLFGLRLVEDGYRFAVWGDGRPWVRHIGERTGFGY